MNANAGSPLRVMHFPIRIGRVVGQTRTDSFSHTDKQTDGRTCPDGALAQ